MQQTLQSITQTQQSPSSAPLKSVAAERPMLLSSASLADFAAWEESWQDYTICQRLSSLGRDTRVSAVRQVFDEDIRGFLREGIIPIKITDDSTDIIAAVKLYIRRQRNPLLDRLDFYNCRQQRGEWFDSFFTSPKELFNACDFSDLSLCSNCNACPCSNCPTVLLKVNDDTLRDRIVVGILDDDTRHKLLAEPQLTMESAVKMTTPSSANALRRSAYKQQKFKSQPAASQPPSDKPHTTDKPKCPNCGRTKHTKSPCPASKVVCSNCRVVGHFVYMSKVVQISETQQGRPPEATAYPTLRCRNCCHWYPRSYGGPRSEPQLLGKNCQRSNFLRPLITPVIALLQMLHVLSHLTSLRPSLYQHHHVAVADTAKPLTT